MPAATEATGVKVYPMTYEQEGMWLDDHLDDEPSRYLESWVYRLSGPLDLDAVEWALAVIVDRHEVLRSRLVIDSDQLVQIVQPENDTRLLRRPCRISALGDELRRTVSQPLDLDVSPLRATLLELAHDESVLVIQFHHAVVDDCALAILDSEFGELYSARVERRSADLPPLPLQLGEYARAQRSAGVSASVLRYWKKRLEHLPQQNSVPPDRPRPAAPSHRGGQVRFRIGSDTSRLIRRVGRSHRSSPFIVLAAALTALVCAYNGTSDQIIGTPVSRRGAADLDRLMGCLTDLLPLRQVIRPGESFGDLVESTREVVWEAVAYRKIPYSAIVAGAIARKDLRMSPLCQTVLVVDDARLPLNMRGLKAERLYVHSGATKFDLLMMFVRDSGGYEALLDYASDLYDPRTAERIAQDFQTVLETAVNDPGKPLSKILQLSIRTR
jgi:hypothetical protein